MASTPTDKGIGKRTATSSENRLSKKFKARTPSPGEKTIAPDSFMFYHLHNPDFVDQTDAPSCLIVRGNKYMERALTEPMYKRKSNKIYGEFVDNVNPYPLVVNPIDDKGNFLTKPNNNRKSTEDKTSFVEKVIVIECDASSKWDPDFKDFFETTLKPNVENLVKTPIFRTKPTVLMTEESLKNVKHWSLMLPTATILEIVDAFYVKSEGSTYKSVEDYLKQGVDIIYSLFENGKVPIEEVIQAYNLSDDHLLEDDTNRYNSFLKQLNAEAGTSEETDEHNE